MVSIILASSSKNRVSLLKKLHIDFRSYSPDIDESKYPDEKAQDLVRRLSISKAKKIAEQHTGIVIGSDQVLLTQDRILNKPITHNKAIEQLLFCSEKSADFLTGVYMLNTETGKEQIQVVSTKVLFRKLTLSNIENYLVKEKPYNCAGSLKSEGLGISLCQTIESQDPSALIGLPLITVVNMLNSEGISPI